MIKYFVVNKVTVLLLCTITLQSFSFLSVKYATLSDGLNTFMFMGLAFLFIAFRAFLWQKVIRLLPLSYAYPFTSLVQVLILFYGVILFNETVSWFHMLGTAMMLLGLIMIAQSNQMQVVLVGVVLVFLNTFGQLLLKKAAGEDGDSKCLWLGYTLFLLAVMLSYFLMQDVDLKYFTVVMSLNYLSVLAMSVIFLGESLNRKKIVGTFFVLIGIALFIGDKF